MTAFPDMKLFMDGLSEQGDRFVYRWTLAGTNTASAPMGSSPSHKATSTAQNTSASWNEASTNLSSLLLFLPND